MDQKEITEVYQSDAYIAKNPSLHEEDSAWKIKKLLPFIDTWLKRDQSPVVTVLDVGGGAGVILRELAKYIATKHGRTVRKYCLDLSPGMLAVQGENNIDAIKKLERDIAQTGLGDKEVDLVLMIDVLEHVPDPVQTLKEIRRISHFALLKVPLEDSLFYRVMDIVTGGKFRQRLIAQIGHINIYNRNNLLVLLEQYGGRVLLSDLTNVYEYLLTTKQRVFDRWFNRLGSWCWRLSPSLAAKIFNDYVVALVACDETVSSLSV